VFVRECCYISLLGKDAGDNQKWSLPIASPSKRLVAVVAASSITIFWGEYSTPVHVAAWSIILLLLRFRFAFLVGQPVDFFSLRSQRLDQVDKDANKLHEVGFQNILVVFMKQDFRIRKNLLSVAARNTWGAILHPIF
jgi:hypothetical protein